MNYKISSRKRNNFSKQSILIRELYNADRLPLTYEKKPLYSNQKIWNDLEKVAGSFLVQLPDRTYIDNPLHVAVKKNMVNYVSLLYQCGAVQSRDFKQWYPIHYVTRLPEKDACIMVLALIKSLDDLHLKTAFNETIITMAREANMHTLSSLLEWIGKKFPYMLHAAVQEGDIEKIKNLLASGADKYQQDFFGFFPLHYSVLLTSQEKACSVVSLLMNSKKDVGLKTNHGDTLYTLLEDNKKFYVKNFIDKLIQNK